MTSDPIATPNHSYPSNNNVLDWNPDLVSQTRNGYHGKTSRGLMGKFSSGGKMIHTIVERYIPSHHINERKHLSQDLYTLVERVERGIKYRYNSRPLWQRVWIAIKGDL